MFLLMGLSGLGGGLAGVKATSYYQKRKAAGPGRPEHSAQRCRRRRRKAFKAGHSKGYAEGFQAGRRSCPRKHAPGA